MPHAKFDEKQVATIRGLRRRGHTYAEIARLYDVCASTIFNVCKFHHYGGIAGKIRTRAEKFNHEAAVCEYCKKTFRYFARSYQSPQMCCSRRCHLLLVNRPKKKIPEIETLQTLYLLKKWSCQRIAIRYGCSFQAVHYALVRANIQRRRRGP